MNSSNFINDWVSDLDYLGYQPYIESFQYLISNHSSLLSLPIVFGIHGKWGVGKSTFMRLIKNKLDKTGKFFTMELNPWEYGSNHNFVSIFLAKLYEKAKDELCDEEKGIEDPFVKFFKSILKPLKLSTNIGIIKGEYDFSKLSFESQKDVVDKFVSENFSLKRLIHEILNAEVFIEKKIVIFIDDLDRCLPDKVIEVIESIKLVLDSENCIFFLGCDKDYLESALSAKYQDFIKFLIKSDSTKDKEIEYETGLKNFAREYLEKIIQVPISIPELDDESVINFIQYILCKKEKVANCENEFNDNLYDEFSNKLKLDLISKLIIAGSLNPRRIKRILNLIFINYIFLRFKTQTHIDNNIDVNLLSFLGFIRDVEQEYYINFLSDKVNCKRIFRDFYYMNKKEKELVEKQDGIDRLDNNKLYIKNHNVRNYFKVYFECCQIAEKDLNKILDNIDNYISVSNITTSEDYKEKSLETIRNIKSDMSFSTLEVFLNKVKRSEIALDFTIWFFENIYDSDKFSFDLRTSINLFIKTNDMSKINDNFILRIEYDEKSKCLYIRFERLGLSSIFLNNNDELFKLRNFDKEKKQISIPANLDQKTLNDVKKDMEVIFSEIS
ncbi:KAP family P-loop NTPase fold protein [Clostridium kluyveri]|uniref:KAP family P-loop NTPase fold protein n=1 Tax=Clostridium kluyveri TaxID=1534 RepID=UPI002245C77C|nr:P-loop NTPase fold protein [Clostridium kluyveri]UZQ50936.1 KAP family NTPase [Clostridium kluyveri]